MATGVIGDIALVIVVSALFGAVARRCGQPVVIGQILVGAALGPGLLGRLPDHPIGHLFPHQVLHYLTVLSHIAVVIFMFVVGYEIKFGAIRGRSRAAPPIAASALAVPLALGMGTGSAKWIFRPVCHDSEEFVRSGPQPQNGHPGQSPWWVPALSGLPVL